jgi:hypothetical protein
MKHFWYIWCKALGEKPHENDNLSDKIAIIRTVIMLIYLITNLFIIAGILKHWNS